MRFCKRGHPWADENTYMLPKSGAMVCRQCRKVYRQTRAKLEKAGLKPKRVRVSVMERARQLVDEWRGRAQA